MSIDDRYMSLKELSKYSGLSLSSLKTKLRGNRTDPLPHFNTGKKILVKKSEFDQWMERYRNGILSEINTNKVQQITSEICTQLGLNQTKS